ncbi:MAG: diacylglycerol kinase [Candidatus Peribacteraceae bacterium]|nr:diacylglycerol kinase [Candidatus Peribacteraceae bacterium]
MIKRLHQSTCNAFRGLRFVWRGEPNFRLEVLAALLVLLVAYLFQFSYGEISILLTAIAAVLTAEILNTIIEDLLDAVLPSQADHVGRIKDITAGAVLLLSLFAVAAGVLTVVHHFNVRA